VGKRLTVSNEGPLDFDGSGLPERLRSRQLLRVTYSGELGGSGSQEAFSFARALRLVSRAPVFSAGTVFVEDGKVDFYPYEGRGWSWAALEGLLTQTDCRAALAILPDVIRVSEREAEYYNRLTNAHRFFDNAYAEENADMAIISFTTSLEGLLLHGEQELSFRFCLRLAQLLGRTEGERRKLFARAKRLYVCRSKIVHGAAIHKDPELAAVHVVDDIAPDAARLAQTALRAVYEGGLTHVFEQGERVDRLFSELLFAEQPEAVLNSHVTRG